MFQNRFICLLLAFTMITFSMLLSGCGDTPSRAALKENITLGDIVTELRQEFSPPSPGQIGDSYLKGLYGVNPKDVDAYAGFISLDDTSPDQVLAIKAGEGKASSIKNALEDRLTFVQSEFEAGSPTQHKKAMAGQVVVKGDFLFLIILGREAMDADEEMARAEELILRNFQ